MSARARVACAITCSDSLAGRPILGRSLAAWRKQAVALFRAMDIADRPTGAPGAKPKPTAEPRLAAVEVHLCDAREMAVLNYRHLRHRGATDVLTFPLDEPVAAAGRGAGKRSARLSVSGVVVVCPAVAEREARGRKLPPAEELLRYILHGALHLLGEDDKTAAKRKKMHARQERLLTQFLQGGRRS